MAEAGEQHGGLGAVLRAMIDYVSHQLPEHVLHRLARGGAVMHGLLQVCVAQAGDEGLQSLRLLLPTRAQRREARQIVRVEQGSGRVALPTAPPGYLGRQRVHERAAQATLRHGRRSRVLFRRYQGRLAQQAAVGPIIVAVQGEDVDVIHGAFFHMASLVNCNGRP